MRLLVSFRFGPLTHRSIEIGSFSRHCKMCRVVGRQFLQRENHFDYFHCSFLFDWMRHWRERGNCKRYLNPGFSAFVPFKKE